MIRNYLLTAIRNFWKHRVFSLINIAGLAIGISAALVIYLLVSYEFSFDKFHPGGDRIYRVVSKLSFPDMVIRNGGVCAPLAGAVKREVSGIESAAAFHLYENDIRVTVKRQSGGDPVIFKGQTGIVFAEADYFTVFSYQWLEGSAGSLAEPFKVVLSENRAKTYFPSKALNEIPGQIITYNDSITVTVAGIVKDFDKPTDFTFKEFISLPTVTSTGLKNNMSWEDWGSVSSSSLFFVKLKKGTTVKQIETQLQGIREKYSKNDYVKTEHLMQPIDQLHFTQEFDMFSSRTAHKPTLYGLLAVATFLLLLGCINFINLTTAQASARAKEIGIRKTMGSSRFQLIVQFLSETFILTVLATILSILIAPGILKMFADFMPPELSFSPAVHPGLFVFIIVLIVVVTLLSGFYPALVLSRLKPARVIKNQSASNPAKTRKAIVRRSLTVSQFVIAQFLIIATILVGKQIRFAMNKELGFRKDAIVNVQAPWNDPDRSRREVLLHKIRSLPGVEKVSLGWSSPAAFGYSTTTMKYNDGKRELETSVELKSADSVYFDLYDMKLLAGRWPHPSETTWREYAINETYAKFLGFTSADEAIGKMLDRGSEKVMISGVLKDFHARSVHTAIKPLVYGNLKSNHSIYHILLKPDPQGTGAWKKTIDGIEKHWKEVYPGFDFSHSFLDKTVASFYQSEKDISRLLIWATGLAIFISCLGMLGLVIYTTSQRMKEIGVRKVLGASVAQIVSLLSKDFIQLVILAFVIAAPVAWWAMHRWLEDFAYRTSMSWWVFAASGLIMIVIALLTLSAQTIRAAVSNPVKSLRTE